MKRFTDTAKWRDSWFMDLPSKWKLAWIWIVDNCDHAGIVDANPRLMSFMVGEPIDGDEFIRAMGGRVIKPKQGKWFVPSFVKFQYGGELNPQNSAHRGVMKLLDGISVSYSSSKSGSPYVAPAKGLDSPCQGAQDKDKDKDKEERVQGEVKKRGFTPPTLDEVHVKADEIGLPCMEAERFFNYYSANGWKVGKNPMKSWGHAIAGWKLRWSDNGSPAASAREKPAWVQIKELTARIANHPANWDHPAHKEENRTVEALAELKALKDQLSSLQSGLPNE